MRVMDCVTGEVHTLLRIMIKSLLCLSLRVYTSLLVFVRCRNTEILVVAKKSAALPM